MRELCWIAMLPNGLFENLGVAKCGLDSKRPVIQPVTFDIGPHFFWLAKSNFESLPNVAWSGWQLSTWSTLKSQSTKASSPVKALNNQYTENKESCWWYALNATGLIHGVHGLKHPRGSGVVFNIKYTHYLHMYCISKYVGLVYLYIYVAWPISVYYII